MELVPTNSPRIILVKGRLQQLRGPLSALNLALVENLPL